MLGGPETVPWPAGARRWRCGRRLRVSIIYSSLVSGCCAACPHSGGAGEGPAPSRRIRLQTTPHPQTPGRMRAHPPSPLGLSFSVWGQGRGWDLLILEALPILTF